MNKGPTLYKPPSYLKKRMKVFAYTVRDKLNSFYGSERVKLVDFVGLEDGSVLIAATDAERGAEALFFKWKDGDVADAVVKRFISGEVPDVTEQYSDVRENIKWEDR